MPRPDTAIERIEAEAAAWFARLDSEDCARADEAGFRQWLAQDAAHQAAFSRITAAWRDAGAPAEIWAEEVRAANAVAPLSARQPRRRILAAACLALLALGAGWRVWRAPEQYETAIGEQRRISLADGSDALLDADTRLTARITASERTLTLVQGRASFNVVPDRSRPFRVAAGDQAVTALGTTFAVALRPHRTEVLLISGKVAVDGAGERRLLTAGERLVVEPAAVRVDRPDLAAATAWRRGRIVFSATPLRDAALEFNRYARRPIAIADADAAELRISGVYSIDDVDGFTDAIARALPVRVAQGADAITIASR